MTEQGKIDVPPELVEIVIAHAVHRGEMVDDQHPENNHAIVMVSLISVHDETLFALTNEELSHLAEAAAKDEIDDPRVMHRRLAFEINSVDALIGQIWSARLQATDGDPS